MVRSCLVRVEWQAGDSSWREFPQYFFLMFLRPLVGDTITAGIPTGVPKKQVSTQASHHDKHQGPLTEDKTKGVLITSWVREWCQMGEESRCHVFRNLCAIIVRVLEERWNLLSRRIFFRLVWRSPLPPLDKCNLNLINSLSIQKQNSFSSICILRIKHHLKVSTLLRVAFAFLNLSWLWKHFSSTS